MDINQSNLLLEMTIARQDAIKLCISLGTHFVEHFHKIMENGKDDINFNHHCAMMQMYFNKVKNLVLEPDKEIITIINLIVWFFAKGSCIEVAIEDRYKSIYERLFLELLIDRDNSSVKSILEKIL